MATSQRKHAATSSGGRALWATPAPNKKPKSITAKILFWKRQAQGPEEAPREPNPLLEGLIVPPSNIQHIPDWRVDPNKFLRQFCQPFVIRCIKSINNRTSSNIHIISLLKVDPYLAPIVAILNFPPTTADRYVPLLQFFFTKPEVARISADTAAIEERIRHIGEGRRQHSYSWWDMIRDDLDEICARAVDDYFAREEKMWFGHRLAHRCRQVNCTEQYRHREVKDWRWSEGKWWLEVTFPKLSKKPLGPGEIAQHTEEK